MIKSAQMIPLGLASPFTTGATPSTNESSYFGDGYMWANISDLGPKVITSTTKSVTQQGYESATFGQIAQPGDLLFSFKLSVGSVSIVGTPMLTNEAIATFRRGEMLVIRFAYYVLPVYLVRAANFNIYGAPLLNDSIMRRTRVPVPPRSVQQRIADYLDRETGEIDAMLGKLDELAETLQRRRIAAISTAIRQSEAHSCALGIIFSFHNGDRGANYPSREEMVSSGVPFINAGHLLNGSVSVENMNFITSDHFKRMGGAKLIPGDILFCLRGSVGKFGMFSSPYQTGALASSLVALRSRDSESDLRYLSFALGSDDFTAAVALSLTGSAQPNLSVDQLAQLQIPAPPPAEQKRIADHLDEVTGRIDHMLAKVAELKALLLERRAALITDVVTGRKEVA